MQNFEQNFWHKELFVCSKFLNSEVESVTFSRLIENIYYSFLRSKNKNDVKKVIMYLNIKSAMLLKTFTACVFYHIVHKNIILSINKKMRGCTQIH